MIASCLVIAALATQGPAVARIPRVPSAPRPVVVAPVEQQPARVAVDLKPDLVVREVRIEEGVAFHALVENVGTADTDGPIRVHAEAYDKGGRKSQVQFNRSIGLKAGESRWIALKPFVPANVVHYTGKAEEPFATWANYEVQVDRPAFTLGGILAPSAPALPGVESSAPECPESHGCFRELDETNNRLAIKAGAVKAWGSD